MENLEMLKALYDFQAVYPKTISFDEGEYFILYQTSARQRNWWQVISMKGNIGFVPSNYVMKLKVEPEFLLGFLDSSIETLELSKESDVNGIMSKVELMERLRERKRIVEKALNNYSDIERETDCESMSSQNDSMERKKLDSSKKSMSQPAVGVCLPTQPVHNSPSMGVITTKASDLTQDISEATSENTTTTTTTSGEPQTFKDMASPLEETPKPLIPQEQTEPKEPPLENGKIEEVIEVHVTPPPVEKLEPESENLPSPCKTQINVQSNDVYEIVDVLRRSTNLSFDMSCEAIRVMLTSFEQLFNGEINPYLEAVAVHLAGKLETPKELLGSSNDAKRLQFIFSQLAECKNDSQQRSWMLYEDEEDIILFLEELVDILRNADENICCYEMSCDQYQSLINLVQYYQMETRWNIKKLLLRAFTAACHLDHIIVDILLTSVLPLEIVEDMKTNFTDLDKFKELVRMLTIIFSLGQSMPVNHQEYLGVQFCSFLFEIVEGNHPENLVDLVITLILAFNQQFTDYTQNSVIESMQNIESARIFTEKILLLLNREEDPVKMLKHSSTCLNSVLKIFIDIFSLPETSSLFYTNDIKVLIDILVRQLTDLCAGEPLRRSYLELCRKIIRNTNYSEHNHRQTDLIKVFQDYKDPTKLLKKVFPKEFLKI
ncbi:NCKIPSD family protein [Megaselia abdita]